MLRVRDAINLASVRRTKTDKAFYQPDKAVLLGEKGIIVSALSLNKEGRRSPRDIIEHGEHEWCRWALGSGEAYGVYGIDDIRGLHLLHGDGVLCVAVGYSPALRGSSHLFVSRSAWCSPRLDSQRPHTHLHGLLGLRRNGLSGRLVRGFHVGGEYEDRLGERCEEGLSGTVGRIRGSYRTISEGRRLNT